MNILQLALLSASLFLAVAMARRFRSPEAVAVRLRDIGAELEELMRYRKDSGR
jgi:hypothetical protein